MGEPSSTMQPSFTTIIRSQHCTAARRWAMMMTVRPLVISPHVCSNNLLALVIERARCFVEDQNARLGDKRPGNRNALPLAP